MALWKITVLYPSKCGNNVVFMVAMGESKHGINPKMSPVDQLIVFVVWLKNVLNLNFTSWLFDSKTVASQMLISWISYIYFFSGNNTNLACKILNTLINAWNIKKKAYPNTRYTLDCTKLFCQSPSSLKAQSICICFINTRHI